MSSRHLSVPQFRDLRAVANEEDAQGIPSGQPGLSANAPQLHDRATVPYPKQLGAVGQIRMAGARLRTMNMGPQAANEWGQAHGYDGVRLAYGKDPKIHMPGRLTGAIYRKDLPRSTRNGW
jgi:hypothetical protein